MLLDSKDNRCIPSNFIQKPIPPEQKITNYFLTGKSNQKWDFISPPSAMFPRQGLISQKFYDLLSEYKLPETYFGNLDVYNSTKSIASPYKLINIVSLEDLSIIDFTASDIRVYSDVTYNYEPIKVSGKEDFLEKRGNFHGISFKKNNLPDLDLFAISNVSGWIISENLAKRLVDEKMSGLFGFLLSEQARIDTCGLYRQNNNFFAT
jgi:hypothetical protein